MSYCAVAFRLKESAELPIESLLDAFAKAEFRAQAVYHLHGNEYNIGAGLNDVRAVVDFDKQIVSLACRYEKDVAKTEHKAQNFCCKTPIAI